jgi:MFS family permease
MTGTGSDRASSVEAPERQDSRLTFAVLIAAVLAFMLTQSTVNPVLPRIQTELGTTQSAVTWVLTANLLAASIATPLMGRLGDAYGKKRLLVVAIGALAVGALMAALATNIETMVGARAVQGIGGGAMPLAFGLARDHFAPRSVASRVGVLAAMGGVGLAAGLVLAGPVVEHLGYRWLFLLPMLVAVAVAVAVWVLVPRSAGLGDPRLPWGPAVLLSAALVCLLLGVSEGPHRGWLSAPIMSLLAAALVLAAAWIGLELRVAVPLVDMRLMRLPAVWTTNLVAFLVGTGMYAVGAFVPAFTQTPSGNGYGFSASVSESGAMLLPFAATSFVSGLLAAPVLRRCGSRLSISSSALVACGGLVTLALAHAEPWQVFVGLGLVGAGYGLVFSALSGLVVAAVPASQTGVAVGMNANIRTIGGSIGAAVMSSIVTARLLPSGFPLEGAYTAGFIVLAAVTALAAAVGLLVPTVPAP